MPAIYRGQVENVGGEQVLRLFDAAGTDLGTQRKWELFTDTEEGLSVARAKVVVDIVNVDPPIEFNMG